MCTMPQCICGSQRSSLIGSLLLLSRFHGSNPYCQACWLVPLFAVISLAGSGVRCQPVLQSEFEANLDYLSRICLKKPNQMKTNQNK